MFDSTKRSDRNDKIAGAIRKRGRRKGLASFLYRKQHRLSSKGWPVGLVIFASLAFLTAPLKSQVTCANVPLPPVDPITMFAARMNFQYSATVNVADVDGDGKLEVVARGTDGIHLWHFDEKAYDWIEAPVSDALTGPPWDLPVYYRSIRLIDVSGDGRPELLARGPDGIKAWQYNLADSSWMPFETADSTVLEQAYANSLARPRLPLRDAVPFPSFSGTQLAIYQYISSQLLDNAPNADIRSQYTNQALQTNFGGIYTTTLTNMAIPSQFDATDWGVVKKQLLLEFSYVNDISNWFNLLGNLYSNEGIENTITALSVANTLAIPNPTNNSAQVALDVVLMIGKLTTNILSVAGGGGPVKTISNLMFSALSAASEDAIGPHNVNLIAEVATLDTNLGVLFTDALVANGCQLQSYMTDWQLMQNFGAAIQSGAIAWGDTLSGQLLQAAKGAYETSILQTLTPVPWDIQQRCSTPNHTCDGPPTQYKLWVPSKWGYLFISIKGKAEDPPSDQKQGLLFNPTPSGAGASVSDVMQSLNGWKMPFGGVCSPVPEASRQLAVSQTQTLLQSVAGATNDEAIYEFLSQPLLGALSALQQGKTTKGSSLMMQAANLVNLFQNRANNISVQFSADQLSAFQAAAGSLQQILLPTTKAEAKTSSPVVESERVQLDGSGSASVDGSELRYIWESIGSNRARFDSRSAAMPIVRFLDGPGKYKFQLTVQDQFGNVSTDVVKVIYKR